MRRLKSFRPMVPISTEISKLQNVQNIRLGHSPEAGKSMTGVIFNKNLNQQVTWDFEASE